MPGFRVATYNIHKAKGLDGRTSVERIARVLEQVDADIVAIQEIVNRDEAEPEAHQASYLATRLGLSWALGETRKLRGGAYGNATLSRRGIELVRHIDLSVSGREERGVLRTDIRLGKHIVHVFNVHLGTGHGERRKQAIRLIDEDMLRAVDISGPRIVLGDFNEWTHGLVSRTLAAEFHLTDIRSHLGRTRSYPAVMPLLHLDHVYFDHSIRVDAARFHRSRLALVASDHLPLVADMHLG